MRDDKVWSKEEGMIMEIFLVKYNLNALNKTSVAHITRGAGIKLPYYQILTRVLNKRGSN